jgi:hypothetical protein
MLATLPTVDDVRSILGLDENSAPFDEVSKHIMSGIRETILDICYTRVEQSLIKITNRVWQLPDRYIVDTNFDGMPDVVVYYYDENDEQIFLEVSEVKRNKVYLTEEATQDTIYADYMAFPNYISDADFKMLCTYRIAYIYVASEIALLPNTFTHGALRYRADGLERIPAMRYNELRDKIIYKIHKKAGKEVGLDEISVA